MKVLANILSGVLYALLNAILAIVTTLLDLVFAVFPPSPFSIISSAGFEDILAEINYIFPLSECVTILEAWVIAVGVYYLYMVVARWVKAIE